MKKFKFIAISVLIIAMVACLTLGTLAFADENEPATPTTPTETDNKIATNSIEAWKFGGGWEITSSYAEQGVKMVVPGADTVGGQAWSYKAVIPNDNSMSDAFSLNNNQFIQLDFSVKFYGEDGSDISKSVNGDALDIYVHNKVGDGVLGILRIWTGSGGAANGSHSVKVHYNGWDNSTDGAKWIAGDAMENSAFSIRFDKQSFFSALVGGGGDEYQPLAADEFTQQAVATLSEVDEVYFKIGGDNGFTANTEITIRAINGQSLANEDGYFTDTVAPVFKPATVSATISLDEEFTIPTEAYDLLGDVTYSVKVGDGEYVQGKTFTPDTEGELAVTLKAVDAAGNSSTKDYTFQVTNDIEAPTITSMPTIENKQADLFATLTFDKPEFTDSTNSATTLLKIYKGEAEEPMTTLTENSQGKFTYFVRPTFETGEYTFVYEITNKGGTTTSNPITVTLTAETIDKVNFVNGETANMVADYVDDGIRLRTSDNFKRFYFGNFDLSEGLDVKFIVNENSASGIKNNSEYINFILTNVDNPVYQIMYRVWLGYSGSDRPTNVYIYDTEHPNSPLDITDTGWISRVVDGVDNKYHMAFDIEETFQGERTAGMQRVDNAYSQILTFLQACPSTNFSLSFEVSRLGASTDYYEAIITEVDVQSFEAPITWQNAKLSVQSIVPEMIEKDETLTIKAYAKDIRQNAALKLTVTSPDGQDQTLNFVGGTIDYEFTQLGNYKLVVSTTGANGVEVKQEFDVVCKSNVQEITIELAENYEAMYDLGSTVAIIGATYSDNVVTSKIIVKAPLSDEVEVAAADNYTFTKPGIYTITYLALDASEPTPNEKKLQITVNVPDTVKPVVEVTVNASYTVGAKVKPQITITDDSEYDVTVKLEKPDKSVITLSGEYEMDLAVAGTYKLTVNVEDIYGNTETVTKTITVEAANPNNPDNSNTNNPNPEKPDTPNTDEPKDNNVGLIVGLCVGGAVLIGAGIAVAIILIKKKKAQ